jgi:ubiquinone/menaquinone biosynthesis C-methylase UbiE
LQRRVQRYGWDKAADYYEGFWEQQLEPAQTRLLEMAGLAPGERVLDIACGTGLVSFRAAEQVGPEGHLLGTDISDKMVEAARVLAADNKFHRTAFERMDAENLSVDEGAFDAALCALGLMYVPDPAKALIEMKRALKPGGRAVSAVWGRRDRCGWAEIFPIVDSRVKSEVCPLFFQLGTGDVQASVFERAGYEQIETDRLATTLYYDTREDALGAAFDGGPVALAYSRFDDKTKEEAHAEYLVSIEPYRKDDGYEIPGEFVITRGIKPASE